MTLSHDETERLRAAFTSTERDDAVSEDCPAADEILAAVREELAPDDFRRVLSHVAGCPVCTEAWRLAEVFAGDVAAEAGLPRVARSGWRRAGGLLAAAALVLVVGQVVRQQQAPEPVTRTAGEVSLALEVGDQPLPRSECLLRWTRFEGARYDVIVSTEDLDVLSKAVDLDRPEYLIPEDDLSAQDGLTSLLAYIEVHRPGEGTVASGTYAFKVR